MSSRMTQGRPPTSSVTADPASPVITAKGKASLASIDQLPRGTALNAARTQLSKENSRTAVKQSVVSALTPGKPTSSSSPTPEGNRDRDPSHPAEEDAPSNNDQHQKASHAADLARRAARRVNVWKRSEQERRGEEEKARQVKAEQEKRRQNHAAHVKQRRRAEIYALNALLRELQQEKVGKYIAAQRQLQEERQQGCQKEALTASSSALTQVRAVGV